MNHLKRLINSSEVQICLTEDSQIDSVTRYIKDGLLNGEGIFVIAKPALTRILRSKMDGFSFDGQAIQDLNQIRFFDTQILLLYLTSDDGLEEAAFYENVVIPIKHAKSTYKRIRALGEMVDILWKQGQHDMLIQLISYFKNLTSTYELALLCIYSLYDLDSDPYEEIEHIHKYHPHLALTDN